MKIFSFITYQLYLLQLENYEIKRFWSLLWRKGYFWPDQALRKNLNWTYKSISILVLSLILILLAEIILLISSPDIYLAILIIVVMFTVLPLIYTISVFILSPIDFIAKTILFNKAKKAIEGSNVKIIGIAGSYGKTTMKNVLQTVLSMGFKTSSTPESVNTPTGIARWVLETINSDSELLVIEMGEHYRGDIKYLCSLARPDIAIVTGINESHGERLGSLNIAIETIFEIVENSSEESLVVLNKEDKNVLENYKGHIGQRRVVFYDSTVREKSFSQEGLFWEFEEKEIGKIRTPILGEYIIGAISAAIMVGKHLGIGAVDLKEGALKINPIKHRLEPIAGESGILVIDDSYNGNPAGVEEAIKTLARFSNRRKIFLTPGLVELGDMAREIHEEIGRKLAKTADLIILIKNSVTPFVADGLKKYNYDDDKIIWFNTAQEAHQSLDKILKPNDVILFQNDWGDQYL